MTRLPLLRAMTAAVASLGAVAVLAADPEPAPAAAFFAALQPLCGQTFAGRIVANEPAAADDPMAGQSLRMQVRECTADAVRIPFHVGDDRSRTWVITRTAAGLRLKHDHRHADGSADALTGYGGDSSAPGSAERQEFPADAESVARFERAGLNASVGNTWALELQPGATFAYELRRSGRHFRVEFDLSRPQPAPPAPWGAGG